MEGYLYSSSLAKISLVKRRDQLVEVTPDVVVCAVGRKLTGNNAVYNRVNKNGTSIVNIDSTDLPTPPSAPKARAASSCCRKKRSLFKANWQANMTNAIMDTCEE